MDSGVSADAIANGAGFVLDISAAFAELGETIESFGLIGRTAGSGQPIFLTTVSSFTFHREKG